MNLIYLEKINSTNDYIKEHLSLFPSNLSGVYTFNQLKGRGQFEKIWFCEPNKGIALSFLLKSHKGFSDMNLNFWVSCLIRRIIEQLSSKIIFIKWPNDILYENKKLCGILIEKINAGYIIGIGINIFPSSFKYSSHASSLMEISPKNYKLDKIINLIIQSFNKEYPKLLKQDFKEVYNQYLYNKDKVQLFKIKASNEIIEGKIIKVDENGLLCINYKDNNHLFKTNEIEFLY